MFALLITAVAAQGLTPTIEIVGPRVLKSEGVEAVYSRSVASDGTVHLRGRYNAPARANFHFKVKNGLVQANVDGVRETFPAPTSR